LTLVIHPDMQKRCLKWSLVLLVLLCPSCVTYISYVATKPPAIKSDTADQHVGFINRYDYTNLPFNNENKKEVFAFGVQQLITSMDQTFRDDPHFDLIILDTLVRGQYPKDIPAPLNSGFVLSLCHEKGIDMLLVLEAFDAFFDTETEVEEYDDGSKSRTNLVDLVIQAGFSLYGKSGEIIDRIMVSESRFYQSRPSLSSIIVFGPSMGKAEEEVIILTERIGKKYIQYFYPSNEVVMNKIYTGKEFSEATHYLKNQQWEEAETELFPLAESADKNLAKKAAHNLAITYEAMGDHERYVYWQSRASK